MKTFEIFLRNGTVARVIAAKMELRATGALVPAKGMYVLTGASDEAVAEFAPAELVGWSSAPSTGNASS